MHKLKTHFSIIIFFFFIFFGSLEANTNQHGSSFDETIPLIQISSISESSDINGKIISLEGMISAQCKNDGCWFKLKDNTGEVLIDMKPYDFRIPMKMIGRKIKLNGLVNITNEKTHQEL